ncbi:hypothetical protein [Prolixibacter sp. SD074]|jgi:hypothetical protein|nr:hypothetical protein [Prolixibacter sp. SD074]
MKRKLNYNDLPMLIVAQLRTDRELGNEFFIVDHTSGTNPFISSLSKNK